MKKKSVFSLWIMSYLFILLVPVIFGATIYGYMLNMVSKQAETVQKETLHSSVDLTEQMLGGVQESAYSLLNTSLVNRLSLVRDQYSAQQYHDMAQLQENLYKVKCNSSYINEI